ncbi:MAG: hypothetical protein WC805_03775 [Patescibacteria group bacterium]|jgi:hypothetical protein
MTTAAITILPEEHEMLAKQICEKLGKLNLPKTFTRKSGWTRGLYLGSDTDSDINYPRATELLSGTYHRTNPPQTITVQEWFAILDRIEELFPV